MVETFLVTCWFVSIRTWDVWPLGLEVWEPLPPRVWECLEFLMNGIHRNYSRTAFYEICISGRYWASDDSRFGDDQDLDLDSGSLRFLRNYKMDLYEIFIICSYWTRDDSSKFW